MTAGEISDLSERLEKLGLEYRFCSEFLQGKIETKEIPIDAEKQKILGKTKAEDLEAKAKELEIEIPEGYKIQPKSTTTKTWSRENLNRYRGKAHSEIFGTQTQQKQTSGLKSDEEFEQYLSEHNNTWLKKIFNGSNRDIRRYDRYLGNNNQVSKSSEESTKPAEKSTKSSKSNTPLSKEEIAELRKNYKEILNTRSNKGREYEPSKNDVGVNPDRLVQEINLRGKSFKFEISKDGKLLIELRRGSKNAEINCIIFDEFNKYVACSSDTGSIHIFSIVNTMKNNFNENYYDDEMDDEPKNQKSFQEKYFIRPIHLLFHSGGFFLDLSYRST